MKKGFLYATKIWLLAVFAAPLLIGIYIMLVAIFNGNGENITFDDLLLTYGLTLVIGGGGTIPVWLFFGILVGVINDLEYLVYQKKTLIQITSILLCMVAFIVFNSIFGDIGQLEVVPLSIPYFLLLSVGIWVFRLEKKSEENLILGIEEHLVE